MTHSLRIGLFLCLALCILAASHSSRAVAQVDPEETLASLDVPAGFEISLWATEPGVVNPTNMDIDERGRVWITEAANYRGQQSRPAGDRIMILEDTNQDGQCDSYKVFYQDPSLHAPLGICKLGNKLYVSQSPNLLMFTIDESGDKPVGEPEVLYSGFTGVNHDHGLHAVVFGPDGRLYGNSGNEGLRGRIVDAEGEPVVDTLGSHVGRGDQWRGKPRGKRLGYQEGIAFRFRPDGGGFETLGHNFRNNYELAVDSFGNVWQSDNDDDGNQGCRVNFVMEGGNFGYKGPTGNDWRRDRNVFPDQTPQEAHWHQRYPGVVPNMLHTGAGSPSGMLVYEGALFGDKLRGALVHCEPGANAVWAYLPQPSSQVPTGLMKFNDKPDDSPGAGYAAEAMELITGSDPWFRPVDACVAPDGSIFIADWYDPGVGGHATGDRIDNGGLRGRIYRLAPRGHQATKPTLKLDRPADAIAALNSPNHATRYLGYQQLATDPQSAAALAKLFASDANPIHRARALWVLAELPEGAAVVRRALGDGDANIRVAAVRAARLVEQDMVEIAKTMKDDESPAVLRELALAMNYEPAERAVPVLVQLVDRYDGQDRWYLEAIGIGATGREPELLRAWSADGKNEDARVAAALRWRLRGGEAVQEIASSQTRYVEEWNFIGPFRATEGVETKLPIEEDPGEVDLTASHSGVDGKKLTWGTMETKPIQDARYANFSDYLNAQQYDLNEVIGYFAVAIESPAAQDATLLLGSDDRAMVWLNGEQVFESTRGGALEVDADRVPVKLVQGSNLLLFKLYNRLGGTSLSLGVQVADARRAVALSLQLPTAAERAAAVAQVANPLTPAGGAGAKPTTKDGEVLPPIAELVGLTGDPGRGEAVYMNAQGANCIACHQIGNRGEMIGPPLNTVGDKLNREQLLEAILHPSAAILMGYENWAVETVDGEVFTGLKDADTPDRVTIKDITGLYHDIPAEQVADKTLLKASVMPESANTMTRQELLDLVAYLATLKKAE